MVELITVVWILSQLCVRVVQVSADSIASALVACILGVCALVQTTVAATLSPSMSVTIKITVWCIGIALFHVCLGNLRGSHCAETCSALLKGAAFVIAAIWFHGLSFLLGNAGFICHPSAVVDEVVTAEVVLAFFVTLLAIIIQNALTIVANDLSQAETGLGRVHELVLELCLLTLNVVLEELPDLFFDGATLLTVGKGGAIVEFVTGQVRWALVPALVATWRLGQLLVLVELGGVEWTLRPWPHGANLLFALANGPFGD